MVLRLMPIVVKPATAAIEIIPAMNAYSIAVAPASCVMERSKAEMVVNFETFLVNQLHHYLSSVLNGKSKHRGNCRLNHVFGDRRLPLTKKYEGRVHPAMSSRNVRLLPDPYFL
jgi:hypothetical protein